MRQSNIFGTGEGLLLLHGALVSQAMWRPQIDDFGKFFSVFTLDLPAHGTTPDLEGKYTVEALAHHVISQLDESGITQTHLIGHSLGGMVAQYIASTYPGRVRKLILAETAFGLKNSSWERLQSGFAHLFLKMTPQSVLVDLSVKQYGSQNSDIEGFVKKEMGRYDHKTSMRVMGAAFQYAGRERLHEIQSPTLVMVGQENKRTHSQGREIAARIPNSQFVILKRAGHLLNLENPVDFNREVIQFLKSDI